MCYFSFSQVSGANGCIVILFKMFAPSLYVASVCFNCEELYLHYQSVCSGSGADSNIDLELHQFEPFVKRMNFELRICWWLDKVHLVTFNHKPHLQRYYVSTYLCCKCAAALHNSKQSLICLWNHKYREHSACRRGKYNRYGNCCRCKLHFVTGSFAWRQRFSDLGSHFQFLSMKTPLYPSVLTVNPPLPQSFLHLCRQN